MTAPRLLVVFGTRPEAIKLAPLIARLLRDGRGVTTCATGQHRDLVEPVLRLFGFAPDVRLDVPRAHADIPQTSELLAAVDEVVERVQPELVVVQGDTTSALAAAFAAFYRRIPVAHVEAGLRTRDLSHPYPEEMHRQVLARLARLHFAPTEEARANLLAESIPPAWIHVTGNTVIDALQAILAQPCELPAPLDALAASGRPILLVTSHRRESFGEPLAGICRAVDELAARRPDHELVWPVHPNPSVASPVRAALGGRRNIHLLPPLGYLPFVHLLNRCRLVLTDSGGLQEEAPPLGKPVLVLRERTDRPEAVAAGAVRLVGTGPARIVAETERLLDDAAAYAAMSRAASPFGDGHAAERIAAILARGVGAA